MKQEGNFISTEAWCGNKLRIERRTKFDGEEGGGEINGKKRVWTRRRERQIPYPGFQPNKFFAFRVSGWRVIGSDRKAPILVDYLFLPLSFYIYPPHLYYITFYLKILFHFSMKQVKPNKFCLELEGGQLSPCGRTRNTM